MSRVTGLTRKRVQVIAFLVTLPAPATPAAVADHFGWDRLATGKLLRSMAAEGLILQTDRGLYMVLPSQDNVALLREREQKVSVLASEEQKVSKKFATLDAAFAFAPTRGDNITPLLSPSGKLVFDPEGEDRILYPNGNAPVREASPEKSYAKLADLPPDHPFQAGMGSLNTTLGIVCQQVSRCLHQGGDPAKLVAQYAAAILPQAKNNARWQQRWRQLAETPLPGGETWGWERVAEAIWDAGRMQQINEAGSFVRGILVSWERRERDEASGKRWKRDIPDDEPRLSRIKFADGSPF